MRRKIFAVVVDGNRLFVCAIHTGGPIYYLRYTMSQVAPHPDPLPNTFSPSSVLLTFLPPEDHPEDVNQLYIRLPEKTRKGFTKDDLAEYLDSRDPKATQDNLVEAINEGGHIPPAILKDAVGRSAESKLQSIHRLNISPRQVDVLIAQVLFENKYALPRPLDPYNYATHGIQQSYETLTTNALFSTRSIIRLQGDSVHFMMFAFGQSQIRCKRFSFGENPVLSASGVVQGNPCNIDEKLCNVLGIADCQDSLGNHALRLGMIQHIVQTGTFDELGVQALFCHWLGELVRHLDGIDGDLRVTDVTGMASMVVTVEVCNEYLALQHKPINPDGTGLPAQLSMKSDFVVCKNSLQGNTANAFLYSAYHVEMKQAFKLKNSAMDCKSQLLAESLARSLSLLNKDKELPQVLYSMLCDGLCLHVLVHFPRSNVAYLSHREIEPGRMTCVVTWLHNVAARKNLTEAEFLEMGLQIGDYLDAEVKETLQKKRERKPEPGRRRTEGKPKKNLGSIAPKSKTMCIDVVADEERERLEAEQREFSAFLSFQNHYRYGDPLPLTETILNHSGNTHEEAPLSMEEKLLRAGFV